MPLNYRGISLNPCMSKVFNSILEKRIISHCNQSNILVDEQNGFRQNRSCEDHIFALNSVIQNHINSGQSIFCAFIDLEKAFDWIDRDLLFHRLLNYNIEGKIYKSIKNMYSNTLSCIRINNILTNWFKVNSGVKQGDTLSPTLFNLYINDLAKEIKSLNLGINVNGTLLSILLYADDMVFIAKTENDLQAMLNVMYNWCNKWRLNINETKSNIVHFRPKNLKRTNFEFKYGHSTLNIVGIYKYLGVYMDEHLTYSDCINALSESAGRALGGIIGKFKQFKDIGYNTFEKLFNSGVVPILDYASSVWGSKRQNNDKITNKAIRYYLGVHRFAPNAAIKGDIGWLTDKYRRKVNMVRLWNRLVDMPNDRITKKSLTGTTDY